MIEGVFLEELSVFLGKWVCFFVIGCVSLVAVYFGFSLGLV